MAYTIALIPNVRQINIEKYGMIEKANIKFNTRLNLIVGKNGSGKSTVINYLLRDFSEKDDLLSKGSYIEKDIEYYLASNCLVIDDLLLRLDNERLNRVLKKAENSGRQVIATLQSTRLKDIDRKIKANLILTENFKLRNVFRKHEDTPSRIIHTLKSLQNKLGTLIPIIELRKEFKNQIGPEELKEYIEYLIANGVITRIKKDFVKFI